MNQIPLTLSDMAIGLGAISAVLGLWWRVETRVSAGAKEALSKAYEIETSLHDYKLEVAENYAKNTFIKDVEGRIVQRFDAIVTELHGMREDFRGALVEMAKNQKR